MTVTIFKLKQAKDLLLRQYSYASYSATKKHQSNPTGRKDIVKTSRKVQLSYIRVRLFFIKNLVLMSSAKNVSSAINKQTDKKYTDI
jgi:hypothetical protein